VSDRGPGGADRVPGRPGGETPQGSRAEQQRARLAERLEAVVASVPGVVWESGTSPDGNQADFVSPYVETLLGYSVEEWLTAPGFWISIVHPDDRRRVEEEVGRIAAGGGKGSVRFRWVDREGQAVWVEAHLAAVLDRRGRTAGMRGVALDVTDRVTTLAALSHNEVRFRKLVEHSADAITLFSAEGTILYGTPASTRILGVGPEELSGRSVFELVHPEDRQGLAERLTAALRHPGEPVAVEARARHRDGGWRHLEGVLTNLLEEPGVAAVVANYRDVTGPRGAREALRASEARLRAIFDSTAIGIAQVDLTGRILEANPPFAMHLGYVPEELIGRLVTDITHPEDVALGLDHFKDLVDGKTAAYQIEKRYVRKDGSVMRGRLTASAVRDQDARTRFVIGMVEDVTERERLEAQLRQAQKMEAIGQLAGGVAHDFNNLLGIITGYSELLEKDLGPDHQGLGRLQQIRRAADRAAGLTRQLLAFSRKQILQPRILDLGEVVSDVEKMLRRLIGEDVQVVTAFGPGLGRVQADPGQIEQVLVNLAVNARDAMPGGGKLIIETANADLDEAYARTHDGVAPGRYVLLSVSDTGHGMDAETLSHMFEPFFTTKLEGKGTGLGLATVYGIVRQSGGHVNVYSEPGRGTTFRIYLPRTAHRQPDLAAPGPISPPRGSETVMLVEDAEVLRLLMKEVLDMSGYRVLEIARPEEAAGVAEAHEGEIHLLVTDVVMPNLSGRDTAERVRARRPSIKVLYVSGYTDDVITHHGVLEATTHLLQKPFTTLAFLRRVREVLDQADAPQKT